MASDVYLQIDGIKGESDDSSHKGRIECSTVHWGIMQPRSACASSNGGHTAERCELDDIMFDKIADLSSPILMQTCATGKTIPKAKFEFMRADGDGRPIKYVEIELENVLIGQIIPGIVAGSLLSESVCLKFAKVKWKYSQSRFRKISRWDVMS
ncbi:type VI secretion system tube protein Hcp [Massilia aurea]|uniref:Hcp family type VI secretion system effector n=1 Tax=Massilia aurea TaxID=373040 RepID=UPI00346309B8